VKNSKTILELKKKYIHYVSIEKEYFLSQYFFKMMGCSILKIIKKLFARQHDVLNNLYYIRSCYKKMCGARQVQRRLGPTNDDAQSRSSRWRTSTRIVINGLRRDILESSARRSEPKVACNSGNFSRRAAE